MAQGRSIVPLSFPLTADTTQNPMTQEVNCFRVFISRMPPGARDVRLKLDGTDAGYISEGRYWDQCEGDVFRHISIFSPAQSGAVEILACNRDALPFDSGGASAGGDLRRPVESWWMPHQGAQAGGAVDLAPLPTSVPVWSQTFVGGAGLVPVVVIRTIRCAYLRGNGGVSGFMAAYAPSWTRKWNEVMGGGVVPMISRLHPRVRSYNFELLMRCEGAGNSHGGGGQGTGLMFVQGDGVANSSLSGNIAGFGIVRDGAVNGGWRFVSRVVDGAALDIDTPLYPGPVTSWVKFRVELIDADPVAQQQGKVLVYANDIPVLSFRDADMDKFPPTNAPAGLRTGFDVKVASESANVDNLTMARVHWWLDSLEGGNA